MSTLRIVGLILAIGTFSAVVAFAEEGGSGSAGNGGPVLLKDSIVNGGANGVKAPAQGSETRGKTTSTGGAGN